MKRNVLMGAVAFASLATLTACGGGSAPAEEAPAEEAAAPAEEAAAEEAPAEEVVEAVPAAEANGNVIEIAMYTKDPDDSSALQVFKPRLVEATVGDTIKFVAANPTHQSSSIDGMIPDGVEGWEGKINEEVSYVIPTAGVYGYKCVPHYAAGMVGLIVVDGGGDNVDAAKAVSHPGLAGREFGEIFEEAGL
ncbi:MAG: plastocyanin/azurin family copper-binding protein [Erythrobacter sp.]|uniref:plastocyanin/azurin family copper-binding protein n=1 Tax=Erythrobacter sp. TaxID=1042 RepID=UPI0026221240|nr:plastocyanin/azurin family copper-binding protein [Erythrobacter sp.]MDJ0979625.1 plastocyanin/azurin family copper-binding protein [Erythrobacter sp.]